MSAYNVRVPQTGPSEAELRRKGQQDGALARRGDSWHIFFRHLTTDANGNTAWTKTSRVVGPATGPDALTKREARRLGYDRFVAKANGMTITPGGLVTVQEFYDRHYDPEHLGSLAKGSQYAFRSLWRRHLLPSLGKCNLADVNQRLIQTVITAKGNAGLSSSTIKHLRNQISSLFDYAEDLLYFSGAAPTRRVVLPERKKAKRRLPMSAQQVEQVKCFLNRRDQIMLEMLAILGLRIGELCGLRWDCVNLTERPQAAAGQAVPPYSILVQEQRTRAETKELKTECSVRVVALTSGLWVSLMEWRETSKTEYVFAGKQGKPINSGNHLRRVIKPAAVKAGVPEFTFHALRHTARTAADQHMTMAESMQLLGHTSPQTSVNYTHPDIERMRQQLERVEIRGRTQ
jgi:integrase